MIGLYGNGMHDFVLREAEVGTRAAHHQDSEDCGFGPLFDLQYDLYLELEKQNSRSTDGS